MREFITKTAGECMSNIFNDGEDYLFNIDAKKINKGIWF